MTSRYVESEALFGAAAQSMASAASALERELVHGAMLVYQASTYFRLGNNQRGEELLEAGLALQRSADSPEIMGLALNFRGMFAHERQDYEAECRALRESIECFRTAGDHWGVAYSMNDLGLAMFLLGDPAEAKRLQAQSLSIFTEIGDKRGRAFVLHNLGVVAGHLGEVAEAREYLREALDIRYAIHHVWGAAMTLIQLGVIERLAGGDDDDALDHLLDRKSVV